MRGPHSNHYYKWYALALLILVGLINYMDRLSISILQVPIKHDLSLSDTELGAITGLSFSLVYTFAALPVARLADRYSPRLVIAVSLAVWSAMTALCGLANSFFTLAILRMGVAVGEAGCGPATQALLAYYFPLERRGRAIALWQMVFPLGALLGIAVGGLMGQTIGWRQTFILLGAFGLAFAPIVWATISDAPVAPDSARSAASKNLAAALRELWRARSFRNIIFGGALLAFPLQASLNWNAPFYGRIFDLPISDFAIPLALIAGLGGAAGIFGGGFLADLLGRRDSRWYCWLPALAVLAAPPFAIAQYYLAADAATSLLLGVVPAAALNCWLSPQAAIAQSLVNPGNRAVAAGCLLVSAGLVGAALGPFLTGVLSDAIAVSFGVGEQSLRYALSLVSLVSLGGSWFFFAAARDLRGDLAAAQAPAPVSA